MRSERPASEKGIPDATIARLPVYLRTLNAMADEGVTTISSGELADAAGVNSAQLRKDLSYLGTYGTRGVGYDVEYLRFQIGREIGSAQEWPVIIVGLGNLGTALANYSGFGSRGFRIVALLDPNPALIGREVVGVPISDLADLEKVVRRTAPRIAVLATPASAAQDVTDRLIACGVRSILNFAPTALTVPPDVNLRKVDLGQELQILAYHEQQAGEQTGETVVATTGVNIKKSSIEKATAS
ncbi:redox-sensing transcriptional repressor Rex [Microlunatus sp. Gsoil 973]|jgi:redox-sensing transcriptional repressor|uniref:redox-sensing transcriptional repressor Rex n=1 Tax=Microlunatus sp. Gsoil 973 TaxID=2672569 RepID=UPI0012B4C1BF|nr:redox-sensing transcriptional repressor Rex [Microlunatus sp. Gsoil 973]QGN35603.1 redox-sensing transcriptional repressor Rex [Microlunatus sp. Gsoil 973]